MFENLSRTASIEELTISGSCRAGRSGGALNGSKKQEVGMGAVNTSVERGGASLAGIKELRNLSVAELEAVTDCCRTRRYAAGETIIRHQDDTNSTFFIVEGMVRVTYNSCKGHEVILCDLSSGDIFGELAAIDGHTRSATVTAKKDSVVASLPTQSFLDLIYSNKEIYLVVLKRLTSQVRHLIDRVYGLSALKVPNRIRAELLRLAKTHSAASNRGLISPVPTHAEIAIRLNTHRETVTRELNALARQKVIARTGRDLHILDMTRLGQMVNGND
ncbi:cAMP-binding domain of CRP or a regulatory subunit of cAMP-dependent protein kinases [Nitrosospira multiformis]|uniref:cAMP-binding domain of CRP or a regulatory subunit of cAMP-dependent protein kinases n=1 Tax=Nitrosospira multiformis TaxID=1231 RepID=A0A1H9YFS5_9PROT|nr:Crp/Fnr family transcriptional regulator [Nitrosospira multiformis]SES67766.1 cAMP-binding domain of CRP or a regulatory subunit of cAMP-dependent protein kinases [Nitrosospira multiformis]